MATIVKNRLKIGHISKAKKELEVSQILFKTHFLGNFDQNLSPVKCYSLFVTSVDMLMLN